MLLNKIESKESINNDRSPVGIIEPAAIFNSLENQDNKPRLVNLRKMATKDENYHKINDVVSSNQP